MPCWQACGFHKINILIGCSLVSCSNTTYKIFPEKSVYLLLFFLFCASANPLSIFGFLTFSDTKELDNSMGCIEQMTVDLSLFFFHMKGRPEDRSHIYTHKSKIILRHYIVLNRLQIVPNFSIIQIVNQNR